MARANSTVSALVRKPLAVLNYVLTPVARTATTGRPVLVPPKSPGLVFQSSKQTQTSLLRGRLVQSVERFASCKGYGWSHQARPPFFRFSSSAACHNDKAHILTVSAGAAWLQEKRNILFLPKPAHEQQDLFAGGGGAGSAGGTAATGGAAAAGGGVARGAVVVVNGAPRVAAGVTAHATTATKTLPCGGLSGIGQRLHSGRNNNDRCSNAVGLDHFDAFGRRDDKIAAITELLQIPPSDAALVSKNREITHTCVECMKCKYQRHSQSFHPARPRPAQQEGRVHMDMSLEFRSRAARRDKGIASRKSWLRQPMDGYLIIPILGDLG